MFSFRCFLFLMLIPGSVALGDLFVGFLSYTGHFNKDALGSCCSGSAGGRECTEPCNLLFDVSVLNSNGTPIGEHQRPSGIPLRSYHNDVIFPMPFLSDEFINPLKFGLNKLTPDLTLSVQVYDVDPESFASVTSQDTTFQLVDNMTFSVGLSTPSDFFDCRDIQGHIRSGTRLKLALRFSCHPLYAGDDCATDCLRSQRSQQCLNQDPNHTDSPAQTNWPFGSPLARCPAIPQKPSTASTPIPPTMTSMPSHIVQTTPTQIVTGTSNFVTDSVNTQTERTATVDISNDLTSSMYGTYTSATNVAKTNILTASYSTDTLTTDSIATGITTHLYETQTARTNDVYSDMPSHLHSTQTVSTDGMNTDMISGSPQPQMKVSTTLKTGGTSDISPTLTGASSQILNPTTTFATEITPSAYITINSNVVTSMSTSNLDSQSTVTALAASMTTTSVSKIHETNIATSFTILGTSTISTDMNTEAITTVLPSLTTLSMETSSRHKVTPLSASASGSISMPSRSSSSPIMTAVTKSTDNNIPTATVSVSGTTPNSETTSRKSRSPNVMTSPKPRTPDRPETTNKIVQPTLLDDSSSSTDPMQFWAIIVGSVLGGLAVVGISGYVIYRSRQKTLQKRQEIYTVTPQITSMIEENGTSGRSDVPMTTALL